MNILFIVPYAPNSIRTRPYNLLRNLARHGHTLTVATLWENEEERGAIAALNKEGVRVVAARLGKFRSAWNCLQALGTSMPVQAAYCWQPRMAKVLGSMCRDASPRFDVIHVEHLRGARYGLWMQQEMRTLKMAIPLVWDSVDCISHLFAQAAQSSTSHMQRIITRLELGRTGSYEGLLLRQFGHILVTSPIDKRAIEESGSRFTNSASRRWPSTDCSHQGRVHVIPNGVDLENFVPSISEREPATVVLSGKMSYHANVTAATYLVREIMPRVWKQREDVRVKIVGKNPPASVNNLSADTAGLVEITGTVPEVRPYLQTATVAVAPMPYGAGIQNKVLEAMACATPVVATSQAASALCARGDVELMLADDAECLARQILKLLDDSELRKRIGDGGRRYVERYHKWDTIVGQLEDIYREAMSHTEMTMRAGCLT